MCKDGHYFVYEPSCLSGALLSQASLCMCVYMCAYVCVAAALHSMFILYCTAFQTISQSLLPFGCVDSTVSTADYSNAIMQHHSLFQP